MTDLATIIAAAGDATAGPWTHEALENRHVVSAPSGMMVASTGYGPGGGTACADAKFIANARTEVLALVSAIQRVLSLAQAWENRGRSDIEFAGTLPDPDMADRLRGTGQDFIMRADQMRKAVDGSLAMMPDSAFYNSNLPGGAR